MSSEKLFVVSHLQLTPHLLIFTHKQQAQGSAPGKILDILKASQLCNTTESWQIYFIKVVFKSKLVYWRKKKRLNKIWILEKKHNNNLEAFQKFDIKMCKVSKIEQEAEAVWSAWALPL